MVFFTCSGCGESLKKNKVDAHLLRCRHFEYLTCIDCSKDFRYFAVLGTSSLSPQVRLGLGLVRIVTESKP